MHSSAKEVPGHENWWYGGVDRIRTQTGRARRVKNYLQLGEGPGDDAIHQTGGHERECPYPTGSPGGMGQLAPSVPQKAQARQSAQGTGQRGMGQRRMPSLVSDVRVIPNSFGYRDGPPEPSSGMLSASGIPPRASSVENIQRCKHDDFIKVRVSGDTCAGDGSPSNRGNSDPGGSDTTMWRPPSPASPLA